jgi:hypothetical protein
MSTDRQPTERKEEQAMSDDLARQLRDRGRDDLADQLENPTPEPTPPPPVEDEGDKFLRELREANNRGRVSIPGLLDE